MYFSPPKLPLPSYAVRRADPQWEAGNDISSPFWSHADRLSIDNFHQRGSEHKPKVIASLLYDDASLHVIWQVHDRYMRCVNTEAHSNVCQDSCVEIFLSPDLNRGYCNLEFNAIGTPLAFFIPNQHPHRREGYDSFEPFTSDELIRIKRFPSLAPPISAESPELTIWSMAVSIPLDLLGHKFGMPLRRLANTSWRANLYKCADHSSHPHWASWSDVGELLNFHKPDRFGILRFVE